MYDHKNLLYPRCLLYPPVSVYMSLALIQVFSYFSLTHGYVVKHRENIDSIL